MARLGSVKRPGVMRVQALRKAAEMPRIGVEHGWEVIVGIGGDIGLPVDPSPDGMGKMKRGLGCRRTTRPRR